ncbi:diguanylate cyclase/phosphodiesterase with PAS/PAC sensor(s) [Acidovorax delafieldii 2AN]|uniref:Diguanylate cyclase/phosphodiesterase with PAS/PAC sensor(S) n=1 Tax=Acidovorax delafieldii 2AN TaxID=573060 RepID=C5T4L2_ACIDE|nr:EAL domain-containing protein [Acidovorax delafieldii]EER60584.1 diguanylate cyclase/phosphodiesterase with PAS/PAC sensor(s) [Acidovorax delafieldii 2AN]
MRRVKLQTWLAHGTYPRLFIPILLIMVLVTGVRYHALVATETDEAHERATAELGRIAYILLPSLMRQKAPTLQDIEQALDDGTPQLPPALLMLQWQVDAGAPVTWQRPAAAPSAPDWFSKYLGIEPPQRQFVRRLDDGRTGTLTVTLAPQTLTDQVWRNVVVQSRISALNIFTILFLLTLLLRANARMLARLATASDQFKQGHLDTRMAVTGSLEARAMARAFNDMATKVQSLVHSLRETQRLQSEQLHFTRQLIDALPLPVFVRSAKGVGLDANKAWRGLFERPWPHSASMPADDTPGGAERSAELQALLVTRPQGSVVEVHPVHLPAREMVYYQAGFTTTDGAVAGTIGALVDITERRQAEEALRAEKERAEVTLASIADGVITTDQGGRIETINEAAQFMTGYTAQQALGRALPEVFKLYEKPLGLATSEEARPGADPLLTPKATHQVLIHRSGERYAIEYTAAPIRQADGTVAGRVLVFRDVTETRNLRQQLSWHARHDALTGLYNRTALAVRLTHAIFTARSQGNVLAVCLIDLDHFQAINEQHGILVGDRLLKEVALRLTAFARPTDAVARMGGDEFALLLGELPHARAIEERLTLLLAQLAQPYAIDDLALQCTASVGVAVFPPDNAGPDTLLRHADQAMCQAKAAGRNQMHFFDVRLDREVQTLHSQQTRIAQALHAGELRLHYQPKVNLRTGEIVGMEALMRWQHPERGLLGPHEIFPLIDDTDLIVAVGEWALQEALAQMRVWTRAGMGWSVSVNIAARQFHGGNFVDRLKDILHGCPEVPPARLELEILESAALEDIQYMRQMMHKCQALGVRFALDDFGTGFSSLSYLKRLPAETIKIDQSFVKGILHDPDDLTLVGAIVALASAFHRQVIAEGAESRAHCEKLLQLGCELAQGHGIAPAMPAHEVMEWARNHQATRPDWWAHSLSAPLPPDAA